MQSQAELISYVLRKMEWNQSELAKQLGVSRGQITKWKNGTDILPGERDRQIAELAEFDDENTEWCLFAPDPKERAAWIALCQKALEYCEGGCHAIADDFHHESSLYTSFVLFTLRDKMGIKLPKPPKDPAEFLENDSEILASVLVEFLDNLNLLTHWADTYLGSNQFDDDLFDLSMNLKIDGSLAMAAYWIEDKLYIEARVPEGELPSLKHKLKTNTLQLIERLCKGMQEHRVAFEIDYFDFANLHPCQLDDSILFDKQIGTPNSIEAIIPYEQRRIITLLEQNQAILKEIRDSLALK